MELNLQTTLAQILTQLADFFGTTTQTIMENAPYWLSKYGWYMAVDDCICGCLVTVITVGMAAIICRIVGDAEVDNNCYNDDYVTIWHKACKYCFIAGIVILAIIIAGTILPCAIAPEISGLNYLITLIGD